MSSIAMGFLSATCIATGTVIGFILSRVLPNHHLSDSSKDTIKMAAGMIATLSALVLGLLVASAKTSFDTVSAETTMAGAKIIMVDRLLAKYGPEAQPVRVELLYATEAGIHKIWPEANTSLPPSVALENSIGLERVQKQMYALVPTTDEQRTILAQADKLSDDLVQGRWLLIEQQQATVPTAFYVVLLFWLTMLFLSIGLFAPHNTTVYLAISVAIVSFSAAIFVFDEMNSPLDGMIKISSGPMLKALHQLGH